jgi:type IV pilus assembly protein PilA
MAHALLARVREARGFTLIELLVVLTVIAILAAIAFPSFLGQTLKAKDASAKTNVKRLSGMVEECKTQKAGTDYTMCNSDAELNGTPGLDWGAGPGQVGMIGSDPNIYTAYAVSESKTGDDQHIFYIVKTGDIAHRICTPAGAGACSAGNAW